MEILTLDHVVGKRAKYLDNGRRELLADHGFQGLRLVGLVVNLDLKLERTKVSPVRDTRPFCMETYHVVILVKIMCHFRHRNGAFDLCTLRRLTYQNGNPISIHMHLFSISLVAACTFEGQLQDEIIDGDDFALALIQVTIARAFIDRDNLDRGFVLACFQTDELLIKICLGPAQAVLVDPTYGSEKGVSIYIYNIYVCGVLPLAAFCLILTSAYIHIRLAYGYLYAQLSELTSC